ncbi:MULTISPECIES: TetR family transcriptional regulator [Streptomyces]|uniref:TetR/AcrR family transcriptional regulator n=1 Tax=Streptomyces lycopersici TaxID=2974589 RepID=UPI0021CE689C|nr:TetR family transcriptional regulator [Streptomyces sp. NEAU-383]
MAAAEVTEEVPQSGTPGRGRPRKQPTEDKANGVRKGERTRRRILAAARRKFAEVGYERATIRAIAAEAEVDKSSVIQYFGSKDALFREAVHWSMHIAEQTTDDPGQTVENYLRGMFRAWAADPHSPMAVLLRASMTSEDAAELLRQHITAESVGPMAAAVTGDDARLRAALCSAMLMGIASQRYLLRMPDLAAADVEDILRLAVPLFRGLMAPDEKAERPSSEGA